MPFYFILFPSCIVFLCPMYFVIMSNKQFWSWSWSWIHRSPVNSLQKGQWRGALVFCLICAWTNGWVNNRDAGDLRRHRAHYDIMTAVMLLKHIKKQHIFVHKVDRGQQYHINLFVLNYVVFFLSNRDYTMRHGINYTNPGYGLSLVDTLWNAGSYRQPLEQEGNPMT